MSAVAGTSVPAAGPAIVRHDAVVLAGGRGSRLGGVDKPLLEMSGRTLLAGVLDAAAGATRRVVVGPSTLPVPSGVLVIREDPPFGGPAAALGAGLAAIDIAAPWTLVLAADLALGPDVVPALLARAALVGADTTATDAVAIVDTGGRRQLLTAVYRSAPLRRVVAGDLDGRPLRALLDGLGVVEIRMDVRDIDTWEDAAAFGISRGAGGGAPSATDPPR